MTLPAHTERYKNHRSCRVPLLNPLAIMRHERGEVFAEAVCEKEWRAVRSQHLGDLMDETLSHGHGAITAVQCQEALHCHGLSDLTVFDRTEQRKELIHLHLLDLNVAQEITRKGVQVLGCLHQPLEERVGGDFTNAGHGQNAQTFGQSCQSTVVKLSRCQHTHTS